MKYPVFALGIAGCCLVAGLMSGCSGGGAGSPSAFNGVGGRLSQSIANPSTPLSLIPYADPWGSAKPRFLDIDNAEFKAFRTKFTYQSGQVTLTYDKNPTVPYFVGRIVAKGLKPNFAYQMKLVGKPQRGTRGYGSAGSDEANERIGLAGRWWCDSFHSRQTNFNDAHYLNYYKNAKPGSEHNIYGYLFMGVFVTDEHGNAELDFTANQSYHITWQDQQSGTKDVVAGTWPVQSLTSPYYGYGYQVPTHNVTLHYELESSWSSERTPGPVVLPSGTYNCRLMLTEESFHGSSRLAGYWLSVLTTEEARDTNPNNDIVFTIS